MNWQEYLQEKEVLNEGYEGRFLRHDIVRIMNDLEGMCERFGNNLKHAENYPENVDQEKVEIWKQLKSRFDAALEQVDIATVEPMLKKL